MNEERTGLHRRPAAVSLPLALAALLLSALVTGLALIAIFQREARQAQATEQGQLLARTLDDHASRVFDATAVVLGSLAVKLSETEALQEADLSTAMEHYLRAVPPLRSVAVLDADGSVVTSTVPGDRGLRVDLRPLLPGLKAGVPMIGPLKRGRNLRDLSGSTIGPASFIPVGLMVDGPRPHVLLALVNPEEFANHQSLMLGPAGLQGMLLSFQGELLAQSANAQPSATTLQSAAEALLPRSRQRPNGTYIGTGAGGDDQIVSYRVSERWPVMVVVEQSRREAMYLPRTTLRQLGAIALFGILMTAALATLLHRSLRAREKAAQAIALAQRLLADRERELAMLVRSVQEVLFRTDAQGRLTFVNARWPQLTGTSDGEALGRPLLDIVHPKDAAAAQALFVPRSEATVRQACLTLRSAGGAALIANVAVVPLLDGDRVIGFAGSATDVSARVQAQQALQRQLELNETLIQTSPLPVSLIDARGCYVTVNRAWEKFNGQTREAVVGRPVGFFLSAQDRQRHEEEDRRLHTEGDSVSYEVPVRRADGMWRDMLIKKVMVRGEGDRPAGVLVLLMDVTEFRDAERAVREARDAAEEASRAKTEFIANISHELRTPLQSIIGFSELGMVRAQSAPSLHGMFEEIHASGGRMLALVNDLLDVSKIQSAVGTFHLERADLRVLLRGVVHEFQPLLQRDHKQIQLTLAPQPLVARVDPLRFQQVVRNVVANAVKFSPHGQLVEVRAVLQDQDHIVVTVRDRGPGIPPAELATIFEPFVQSSRTRSSAGGTGLGLAISRQIVTMLGGRIEAANAPGAGAVITLTLPAAEATPATAPMGLSEA